MKKTVYITLLAVMAMILTLSACGKSEPPEAQTEKEGEEIEFSVPAEDFMQVEEEDPSELQLGDYLTTPLSEDTCEIIGCFVEAKVLEVPETINGMTVVGVGDFGFSTDGIEEIILPDTVTFINPNGFNGCADLKKIDLGDGLKVIGTMAFCNCPELECVEFPEGMENIGFSVFAVNEKLEEVYIPASVTEFAGEIALSELCPNLVVVTPAGSAAEQMAIDAGLPVRNP